MNAPASARLARSPAPRDTAWILDASVVALGGVFWWLASAFPAHLPFFLPWDFSWFEFLGIALPLTWYLRGLVLTPAEERPHWLRITAFLLGVLFIYTFMQTRFVY
ncbi:MAG TPA: hypothetical protein VHO91_20625, partial [Rhodopila sp.]|nr:hypothetical protein [Rhodopila sp.]